MNGLPSSKSKKQHNAHNPEGTNPVGVDALKVGVKMTPEEFQAKREARSDRLRERATKHKVEGQAKLGRARDIVANIPMGQPILVGHHSERKHRNDLKKHDVLLRSGIDQVEYANDLERRAEAAENNSAIFSDDPEAITKLEARIVELKADHEKMVAGNKAIRTAKGNVDKAIQALAALGFNEASIQRAMFKFSPNMAPIGFALSNSSADIRRNEKRLEELRKQQAAGPREPVVVGDVTITWNTEANRVQIAFPGKPADDIRERLKSHGFRWAPTDGVWQRHANETAWYWAKDIVTKAQ